MNSLQMTNPCQEGVFYANNVVEDPFATALDTLHLQDLPLSISKENLLTLFGQFGTIADFQLLNNQAPEFATRGCGFGFGSAYIRFGSHDAAARAIRQLNGFRVHGHPLRLTWANKRSSAEPVTQPAQFHRSTVQVLVSFISRDLNVIVTKAFLGDVFRRFGEVLFVDLKKSQFDPGNSVQTGYGFVHFADTPEGIISAFEALNVVKNVVMDGVAFDCRMSNSMRARFGRGGAGGGVPTKIVHPQHKTQRFVGGRDYSHQMMPAALPHFNESPAMGFIGLPPAKNVESPLVICTPDSSPSAPYEHREMKTALYTPPGLKIIEPPSKTCSVGYAGADMVRFEKDLLQKGGDFNLAPFTNHGRGYPQNDCVNKQMAVDKGHVMADPFVYGAGTHNFF